VTVTPPSVTVPVVNSGSLCKAYPSGHTGCPWTMEPEGYGSVAVTPEVLCVAVAGTAVTNMIDASRSRKTPAAMRAVPTRPREVSIKADMSHRPLSWRPLMTARPHRPT
jgi:hypothetical protein